MGRTTAASVCGQLKVSSVKLKDSKAVFQAGKAFQRMKHTVSDYAIQSKADFSNPLQRMCRNS